MFRYIQYTIRALNGRQIVKEEKLWFKAVGEATSRAYGMLEELREEGTQADSFEVTLTTPM